MKLSRAFLLMLMLSSFTAVSAFAASCSDCGSPMDVTDTFQGTCKKQGYIIETCRDGNCGNTKRTYTGYGDHQYDYVIDEEPATCYSSGFILYECSICHGSTNRVSIPVDSSKHHYSLEEVFPSDCANRGYEVYRCSICSSPMHVQLPLDPDLHDYAVSETVPPTCLSAGYEVVVCSRCNNSYQNSIPIDDDAHDFYLVETVRPDVGDAYEVYKCSYCECEYIASIPTIHEHHYTEVGRVDATPSTSGTVTYSCSCGAITYREIDYVEPIPATTVSLAKTVLTGVWGFFGIYVPGFNFTFGQMALGVMLCSVSVFVIKFLFNLGGSGVSSRTSSTNNPRISNERKGDEY